MKRQQYTNKMSECSQNDDEELLKINQQHYYCQESSMFMMTERSSRTDEREVQVLLRSLR
jgi:hypothetical protein